MAATGTCPGCRREQRLDDGRHVATHQRWENHTCGGSGKLSMEASAANAAKSRERMMARLEQLRQDATVAHDAVATGYPWPAHQLLALRKAALQEYRLKFPAERPRRQRLWFMRGRAKRRGSAWAAAKGDVYCTLCRSLLLQRVDRGADYTERTREHTTLCALRCLAGIEQYVAPDHRRIPAEHRADPAEAF